MTNSIQGSELTITRTFRIQDLVSLVLKEAGCTGEAVISYSLNVSTGPNGIRDYRVIDGSEVKVQVVTKI